MGPIPTSSSLSMSRADLEGGFTPTSSSGGQIQIFNIEAYCKLCNKEFCNKYFLKTHLANKHGVYSEGASTGQGGVSLYDKSPMRQFPGSSQPQVSISGSFMAMSSPKTSGVGLLRESPKEDRPQSEMRSPLSSPIRPHSTGASERATPSSQQSPKPGPPPLIPGRPGSAARPEENGDKEVMGPEDLKRMDKELMMGSLPSGIRLPMVPSMSPFGGPMHFDNLLKMNPLSPMDQMRKEAEMDRDDLEKGSRPIPNVPNVPKTSEGQGSGGQNGNMTPDRLRQMGVINADAFCEFCCKEFCNKYFLRVHKLKKHGVCSPELPPEKVQKILQQMAKEAGKTGQPMPPLTMGAPSAIRPPGSMAEPPRSMSGPMGPLAGPFGSMGSLGSMGGPGGLNLIRPPHLPNFLRDLPGMEPGADRGQQTVSREDSQSSSSSDRQEAADREDRPLNFSANSPRSSLIEPECELRIDENAPAVIRESPTRKDPEELSETAEDQDQRPEEPEQREGEASEGLANLQNMIMKLHGRTMMGQEPRDPGTRSPVPVSLPQYPADLSKMGEQKQPGPGVFSPGLTIPNPLLSRQPSFHSLANGFPKLSDKGPSIFEQMQGLPRPSFMDQIKNDLGGGGGGIDIPLSPMKRPSLDRDPNKKPASLSRSYCEICKKELCNKYFMKTHMMKMHGIMMEDGPPKNNVMPSLDSDHLKSRLPPHMRDGGLMSLSGFPGMPGSGEFSAPPPLGEFSRLLMQQGEKNLERQKAELERREREAGPGHVCSLCSNTFPDIIALQVHIIKSHGALPPTTGLDGLFGGNRQEEEDKEAETRDQDIAENEEKEPEEQERPSSPAAPVPAMFPFPMAGLGQAQDGEASKNLQELMARQIQFPGMINPLMGLPMGLAGAAAPNSQFQGLFNMFLSEMLKKVQKDTPPQTPPSSPPPQEDACVEEEARS